MKYIGLKLGPEVLRDLKLSGQNVVLVQKKLCLGLLFSHSIPSMAMEQRLQKKSVAGNFMMRVNNYEQSVETFSTFQQRLSLEAK